MRYSADFFKFFAVICVGCWMVSCGSEPGDSGQEENTLELCTDGIDNDQNGKTDCQEDYCKNFIACENVYENTEALCKDGIDNDNNGKTDCVEDSCKGFVFCTPVYENTEELCKDGIDNDYNQIIDCQEESCMGFEYCQTSVANEPETTETLCSDGFDNDRNGYRDCREESCKQFSVCKDENGNYMRDSEEPGFESAKECIKHSECSSGFCDSFIGKCSTKCTNHSQCLSGFICRPDGRCAAEAFETIWKIKNPDTKIVFTEPVDVMNECDFMINWGDGSEKEKWDSCPTPKKVLEHVYAEPGEYHIKVTGKMTHWMPTNYHGITSADKLTGVVSFGPVGIGEAAFGKRNGSDGSPEVELSKLTSLDSAIDIPDATLLGGNTYSKQSLAGMFWGSKIKSGIGKWDVSRITSLYATFGYIVEFNEDLGRWDTSNVTNMTQAFTGGDVLSGKDGFGGDISKWDTSSVKTMEGAFEYSRFSGEIGNWDTSSVTNMKRMFYCATGFNGDIGNWDTSNVTTMEHMFYGTHFNQDLNRWNVSNVKNFNSMFSQSGFSIAPKSWNVSSDAIVTHMFYSSHLTCDDVEEMLQKWNIDKSPSYLGCRSN